MKKAILVGLLLVFAWTSVVGAQEALDSARRALTSIDGTQAIIAFLLLNGPYGENTVCGYTGHDWVGWTQSERLSWLGGFMAGINIMAIYGPFQLYVVGEPHEWLAEAGALKYRVGVYEVELNALYSEYANRDIYLVDAVFIARERLNGRDVDLTPWRNKGQEQEGT